jgi:hypothetical protein
MAELGLLGSIAESATNGQVPLAGVIAMEANTVGRILTEATIENLEDLWAAKRGLLPPDQVRRVVVTDALADTGATLLSMPTRLINQLGLTRKYQKRVTSSIGDADVAV